MSQARLKEMIERRAKAYAVASAALSNPVQSAETRATFSKAMADVDSLGTDIKNLERSLKFGESGYAAYERQNPWTSEKEVRASWAFGRYLRNGFGGLSADEKRDLTEGSVLSQLGTWTGLGFFVPAGFVYDVEQALKYYAPLLTICGRLDTDAGNPLPYPTSNDTSQSAFIVGEGVDVTSQSTDPPASNVIFGAYKYSSSLVKASLEMVQDSAFGLEQWLSDLFAIRFGRGYERDLTNGNGTTQPQGILVSIAASGAVAVVATGSAANTGGQETGANSIGYTDLVRLEHSVDPAYRRGAKWMLHDTSVSKIKQILDKFGRPIWVPGMATNAPDTILGYPYVVNQQFPQIGASKTTVAFGDFSKFLVRVVKGMRVQRLDERFAEKGEVAWLAFSRLDAKLLDAGTHPINVLQQSS